MPLSINNEICTWLVMSPYEIASSIKNVPYLMSTSNISLPLLSNAPVCARICANAPDVSPRKNKPSLMSLVLNATGVSVNTSPV